MRKAEIDALLSAHAGRARPVAFLHVLRQPRLEEDDHAFLLEHASELGPADLLRWRSRCEGPASAQVIRVLAVRAEASPASFEHEVLGSPRLDLSDDDWTLLASLVEGRVPERILDLVRDRGGARAAMVLPPIDASPRRIESAEIKSEEVPSLELHGPPWDALTTRELFDHMRAGHLSIGEGELATLVMARATAGGEDWSSLVYDFPAGLQDAVVEKTRRTARGNERANLLAWLEGNGASRGALLDLALDRAPGMASLALMSWINKQLSSRAAWEKHGPDVVHRLLAQQSFADLADLATLAHSEANRDAAPPPRGLLEAVQAAFALAFIRAAKEAVAAGAPKRALAVLSALACLDPPSRVSAAVHELNKLPSLPGDVSEMLAVNERLVKHGGATEASLEGLIAAVHVLVDAMR